MEKSKAEKVEGFNDATEFRVSKRPLEDYMRFFSLTPESLKPNSRILDMGSGENQELAVGLAKIRPDIQVVSVDPSLILSAEQHLLTRKNARVVLHDDKEASPEKLKRRLEQSSGNIVIALAPDLPFIDGTFDYLLDLFGAFRYLDEKFLKNYVERIHRILKTGGEAYIFPIDLYKETADDWLDRKIRNQPRIEKIIKDLNIHPENYNFFSHNLNPPSRDPDINIGIKFTKKD